MKLTKILFALSLTFLWVGQISASSTHQGSKKEIQVQSTYQAANPSPNVVEDAQSAEAVDEAQAETPTETVNTPVTTKAAPAPQAKKLDRQAKKELRKELRKVKRAPSDDRLILAVIFAIILPPVGVAIWEGFTVNFWIDLLLTILLPWIGGMIFALFVILV